MDAIINFCIAIIGGMVGGFICYCLDKDGTSGGNSGGDDD